MRGRLSAPANVLLMGEYAITQEGRRGIAFADRHRMYLDLQSAETFCMEGLLPSGKARIDSLLVDMCLEEMRQLLPGKLPAYCVCVDTHEFFHADGRKRGLGSSAALVVGIIAGCMMLGGKDPVAEKMQLFRHALRVHRQWRPGSSGYDVAVTVFGGSGVFVGGRMPSWQPISLAWHISLVYQAQSSDSGLAVQQFHSWMQQHAEAAEAFLNASDACVEAFLAARRYAQMEKAVTQARDLYDELENTLGLPCSALKLPARTGAYKSSGAGRELVLGLYKLPPRGIMRVGQGLRWE